MNDSIPICRSVFKHWIYKDAEYLKVWLTMLGRARYMEEPKTDMYEKILYTLNYGEFIFGRPTWCKDTGISEQRLRRLVELLINDGMITKIRKTSKFTIYKIVNYAKFNQQLSQENQGTTDIDNFQTTDTQPADNRQTTNNKEGIKKDKECIPYAEIQKAFNETCISLSKIKQLTTGRKKHLNARLAEIKNNTETLYGLFKNVEASDFLTNRKNDNRNNWKADFDWIMKPENFTKIIEGKYKNKTTTSKTPEQIRSEFY